MHFTNNQINLPFFPDFDNEYYKHILRITWFETDFSQSRYSFENLSGGSNACTIIAVLMAWKCHFQDINVRGPEKELNVNIIQALARSILEGNDIHQTLNKSGSLHDVNLTVPEAIKFTGLAKYGLTEWKSLLFMEPLCDSLYQNIKKAWSQWIMCPTSKTNPDLYIILISDSRSVLFVIQYAFNTVAVVDSHQHATAGALIAVTYRQRLQLLCEWFAEMSEKLYQSQPEVYELSFLYFKNDPDSDISSLQSNSNSNTSGNSYQNTTDNSSNEGSSKPDIHKKNLKK